jgi:hypothetical protein
MTAQIAVPNLAMTVAAPRQENYPIIRQSPSDCQTAQMSRTGMLLWSTKLSLAQDPEAGP